MYSFTEWLKKNRNVLNYLYDHLNNMAKLYGIYLIDNKKTYTNFLIMMYNESNKTVIRKEFFEEYFPKKYDCGGYEKYKIL
jgi:hypothetical protein